MPLTLTEVPGTRIEAGVVRGRMYDATFDSSYPTGGEPISPKDVGLLDIFGIEVVGQRNTAGANTTNYLVMYDYIADKLQAFASGDAAGDPLPEETATADLSTFIFRILIWGV